MHFSFSKEELLKVPRIAIIYGDPQWANFIEPLKQAFEIPETLFKTIHVKDLEAEFFAKLAQYLLCVICPNTSENGKNDLSRHLNEWYSFFNQGSFLMIFGIDVDWLSKLGNRFQISAIKNSDVTVGQYNFEDTSIAENGICIEGTEALGPWFGEFTRISPAWSVIAESQNHNPIFITQLFGNSQITACAASLGQIGSNVKKIVPVKVLLWGVMNALFMEKSFASINREAKWSASMELLSKYISKGYPGRLKLYIDRFNLNGSSGTSFFITCEIKDNANRVVQKVTDEVILAQTEGGIQKYFEFSVSGLPDGKYTMNASLSGVPLSLKEEMELTVVSSEVEEIIAQLQEAEKNIKQALDVLKQKFGGKQNTFRLILEEKKEVELLRRLIYLRNRVTCAYETLDNMMHWGRKYAYYTEIGHSVTFDTLDQLRMLRDEILVKLNDIPNMKSSRGFSGELTRNQRKNELIKKLGSDLSLEFVWESKPQDSFNLAVLGESKKRAKMDFITIWNNGLPLISINIQIQNAKSIDKSLKQLEKPGSKYVRAQLSILEEKKASLFIRQSTSNYAEKVEGILFYDQLECHLNTFHLECLKLAVSKIVTGEPFTDLEITSLLTLNPSILFQLPPDVPVLADNLEVRQVNTNTVKIDLKNPSSLSVEIGKMCPFTTQDVGEALGNLRQLITGTLDYYLADLHSHSAASDGILKALDCAINAACAGVDIYGLSDHHSAMPSYYLKDLADRHHWAFTIVPGCQEITHIYFHAISLNARKTVFELVPVDQIPAEAERAGAPLIFAHTRLPHEWPISQVALGNKSPFLAFEGNPAYVEKYSTAWQQSDAIPAWISSTGSESGCFSKPDRTVIFVRHQTNAESIQPVCSIEECIAAIQQHRCIGISVSSAMGQSSDQLLLQFIKQDKGTIAARYQMKKLTKFLSLI